MKTQKCQSGFFRNREKCRNFIENLIFSKNRNSGIFGFSCWPFMLYHREYCSDDCERRRVGKQRSVAFQRSAGINSPSSTRKVTVPNIPRKKRHFFVDLVCNRWGKLHEIRESPLYNKPRVLLLVFVFQLKMSIFQRSGTGSDRIAI